MQKCLTFKDVLIVCIVLLIPSVTFSEPAEKDHEWQIHGRSETSMEWQETTGASPSSIDGGTTLRQELTLNARKKLKNGKMGLDMRGRATDNEQIDNRIARLLYLRGYWQTPSWNVELGDVAASFNPLVLSAGAKGLKVTHNTGDRKKGWKHSFISGIQKPSWEETYDRAVDKSVDRYLVGMKSSWKYATAKTMGVSMAYVRDTGGGADSLALEPAEAATAGVDWNWRFNRYFSTKGEAALTRSDNNTNDATDSQGAGAVRIRFLTKPIPRSVRSNFLYERFDTDFKPVVASATSDRERIENVSEWMINRQMKIRMTLKNSRDNLDGSLGDTLTTRDGVLYFTYRPDWLKRSDFGLRSQSKRNSGRGVDQFLQIIETDFNYRPKSGWRYGASWIFTDIGDDAVGAEDQNINTLRGTLGWKKSLANKHQLRASVRLDGHFVDKNSGDQQSLGGRLDFGYTAGKLWSTDLSVASKSIYYDAAADTKYYAYQLRANYHPGGDRSKAIRLSAELRNHISDTATTNSDYREHLVKLSYLFSF